MFINPTIDFLLQRVNAVAAQLSDAAARLPSKETVALTEEYDNLAAAMRVTKHTQLRCDAPAMYPGNANTLWCWYCQDAKLHESHDWRTLVVFSAGRPA